MKGTTCCTGAAATTRASTATTSATTAAPTGCSAARATTASYGEPLGGSDVFLGGAGTDTISFRRGGGPVTIDVAAGSATGEAVDTLYTLERYMGGEYADVLRGSSGADRLFGRGSGDVLRGLAGRDLMRGGGGRDAAYGGHGRDTCFAERRFSCTRH